MTGVDRGNREEIGVLTSLPLLRKVVEDLEQARNSGESALRLYFTKESHIHTLVNLVLYSGLPIANRRIPELDYCVRTSLDFEVHVLTAMNAHQSHITLVISLYARISMRLTASAVLSFTKGTEVGRNRIRNIPSSCH